MTTGLWRVAGVPHKDWVCVDMEDLGEPSEICEMCQVMEIRYVHIMEHKEYPFGPLRCGCVCAGNMEKDRVGARKRENTLKGRMLRRKTWMSKEWRVSEAGNMFTRLKDYIALVKRRADGSYCAMTIDRKTNQRQFLHNPTGTKDGAKAALFDALVKPRAPLGV